MARDRPTNDPEAVNCSRLRPVAQHFVEVEIYVVSKLESCSTSETGAHLRKGSKMRIRERNRWRLVRAQNRTSAPRESHAAPAFEVAGSGTACAPRRDAERRRLLAFRRVRGKSGEPCRNGGL